jgi:Flp pilus assembly secretin CpaC
MKLTHRHLVQSHGRAPAGWPTQESSTPMRRFSVVPFLVMAGLWLVGGQTPATAQAPTAVLNVTLDEAKIARVPEGTVTLVIGNPIVADVTMLKGSGAMVVTGKGFGQTNLIALDARGAVLDEKTVRVVPTNSTLVVQRGMERESYSCAPDCMPTVQLGDGKTFIDVSNQLVARNALVAPSAGVQSQH